MIQVEDLLAELTSITQQHIRDVQSFKQLSLAVLNRKPAADRWSILECVEHLNRYGDFYIPEIQLRINNAKRKYSPIFRPGLLGNYFAKSMLPKERLNKMKTFKSMNPSGSRLDTSVLDKFIDQQQQLLRLLTACKQINLTQVKTPSQYQN